MTQASTPQASSNEAAVESQHALIDLIIGMAMLIGFAANPLDRGIILILVLYLAYNVSVTIRKGRLVLAKMQDEREHQEALAAALAETKLKKKKALRAAQRESSDKYMIIGREEARV